MSYLILISLFFTTCQIADEEKALSEKRKMAEYSSDYCFPLKGYKEFDNQENIEEYFVQPEDSIETIIHKHLGIDYFDWLGRYEVNEISEKTFYEKYDEKDFMYFKHFIRGDTILRYNSYLEDIKYNNWITWIKIIKGGRIVEFKHNGYEHGNSGEKIYFKYYNGKLVSKQIKYGDFISSEIICLYNKKNELIQANYYNAPGEFPYNREVSSAKIIRGNNSIHIKEQYFKSYHLEEEKIYILEQINGKSPRIKIKTQ